MANKRRLTLFCTIVAAFCAVILGVSGWYQFNATAFNENIRQRDWQQAARHDSAYGQFAKAYNLQQNQHHQQALQTYNLIDDDGDSALHHAIQFNMANAYLQLALSIDQTAQSDLVLPLAELAKTSFRELLQATPNHWGAKYNLERTLQLVPDAQEQAIQEWMAPERGPRAVISFEADKHLP